MKSRRNAEDLEDREKYISNLLSNRTQEVQKLELQLAQLEKDHMIKEEQWRTRDNERLAQFYKFKLG